MSVPRKHLWIAATLLSISAPVFRGTMLAYHANKIALGTLTPAYFDFLGLGGLLAIVWENRRAQLALRLLGSGAIIFLGFGLVMGLAVQNFLILWALAFAAVVSKAAEGFTGYAGSLLRWSVLRYIGRISYGIYLYHLPALLLVLRISKKLGREIPEVGMNRFVVMGIATVSIAALSWHLFEGPINRLKRFFPYRPRRPSRELGLPAPLQA